MTDSAYVPPASGFYMKKPSSPGIWRILGIVIAVANVIVWFAVGSLDPEAAGGGGETGAAYSSGYVAGFAMSGILWPAIIALLFRIGKSFRNSRSTWKIFFFACVFFLFAGFASLLVKGAQAAMASVDATSVKFLERIAEGASTELPIMVDEETEFYEVTAAEALLTYHYRMVNYRADDLDPDAFADAIRDEAQQKLCTTPQTRDPLLKKGVTVRFSYFGNEGDLIASFDTTPADCGFAP